MKGGKHLDRIKVSIGRTYNIGNYESMRLDVGLEVDSDGAHNNAFEYARQWTGQKLAELETELGLDKKKRR